MFKKKKTNIEISEPFFCAKVEYPELKEMTFSAAFSGSEAFEKGKELLKSNNKILITNDDDDEDVSSNKVGAEAVAKVNFSSSTKAAFFSAVSNGNVRNAKALILKKPQLANLIISEDAEDTAKSTIRRKKFFFLTQQRSALHIACGKNDAKMVTLLLEHGANPNYCEMESFTPLHFAVFAQRAIANSGNRNELIKSSDLNVLKALLQHGAKVDVQHNSGNTILHFAAAFGLPHIITAVCKQITKENFLLQPNQADYDPQVSMDRIYTEYAVNLPDFNNSTPLHIACRAACVATTTEAFEINKASVEILLCNGAKLSHLAFNEYSVVDIIIKLQQNTAFAANCAKIVELILPFTSYATKEDLFQFEQNSESIYAGQELQQQQPNTESVNSISSDRAILRYPLIDIAAPVTEITEVDVSEAYLFVIPTYIFYYKYLEELYLFSNYIPTLPKEIGSLSILKVLSLAYNSIQFLPEEIGNLTHLEELDVTFNSIDDFPDSFANLTKLTRLYVSKNKLAAIPACIGKLPNLEELDASWNCITALPQWIYSVKLRILDVSNNVLTSVIPRGASKQAMQLALLNTKLVELNCDCNRLESFPPQLKQIQKVSYKNNLIKSNRASMYQQPIQQADTFSTSSLEQWFCYFNISHIYPNFQQHTAINSVFDLLPLDPTTLQTQFNIKNGDLTLIVAAIRELTIIYQMLQYLGFGDYLPKLSMLVFNDMATMGSESLQFFLTQKGITNATHRKIIIKYTQQYASQLQQQQNQYSQILTVSNDAQVVQSNNTTNNANNETGNEYANNCNQVVSETHLQQKSVIAQNYSNIMDLLTKGTLSELQQATAADLLALGVSSNDTTAMLHKIAKIISQKEAMASSKFKKVESNATTSSISKSSPSTISGSGSAPVVRRAKKKMRALSVRMPKSDSSSKGMTADELTVAQMNKTFDYKQWLVGFGMGKYIIKFQDFMLTSYDAISKFNTSSLTMLGITDVGDITLLKIMIEKLKSEREEIKRSNQRHLKRPKKKKFHLRPKSEIRSKSSTFSSPSSSLKKQSSFEIKELPATPTKPKPSTPRKQLPTPANKELPKPKSKSTPKRNSTPTKAVPQVPSKPTPPKPDIPDKPTPSPTQSRHSKPTPPSKPTPSPKQTRHSKPTPPSKPTPSPKKARSKTSSSPTIPKKPLPTVVVETAPTTPTTDAPTHKQDNRLTAAMDILDRYSSGGEEVCNVLNDEDDEFDVEEWLESFGLQKFASNFREHSITSKKQVMKLSATTLQNNLQISAIYVKKIMRYVDELIEEEEDSDDY